MSTTVTFKPGCGWDQRPPVDTIRFIRQDVLAARLEELRQEWQSASGEDLSKVDAPVDLMLNDFASIIELPGWGVKEFEK